MESGNPKDQMVPPEVLLRFAEEEEPRRVLDDYWQVIHKLRDKDFTFREIAEWLQGYGFSVDHNAVWRAYAKTVSNHEAHFAAEADEQLEREEDWEHAKLNETAVSAPAIPEAAPVAAALEASAKAPKKQSKKATRKKQRTKK